MVMARPGDEQSRRWTVPVMNSPGDEQFGRRTVRAMNSPVMNSLVMNSPGTFINTVKTVHLHCLLLHKEQKNQGGAILIGHITYL